MSMQYFCCDERRRNAVAGHATLMGIDFLEVSADQQRLFVHFVAAAEGVVKTAAPPGLTAAHVRITGGERITRIRVVAVEYEDDVLVVTVDDDDNPANGVGDFSLYSLHLVDVPNLDLRLTQISFSFKVECPSDFDCKTKHICSPEQLPEPEIDYLAKDYASFRRLMLDRMALLMPQWRDRNAADLGMVLVELLAHVGDHLSYQQDAVATESYLGSARRRVSVRRHARLVDYFMHDGCNARVWVQMQVEADHVEMEKGTRLLTHVSGAPKRIAPGSQAYEQALAQGPAIFETMQEAVLFTAHNEMDFYTWGERECCLPRGATRATLKGHYSNLKKADVLVFEEVFGPQTGQPEDADPAHRHAVRLTGVQTHDTHDHPLTDLLNEQPITEISWAAEDALPFPLCISAVTHQQYREDISVALGNIVLADHGLTIADEELGAVPDPTLFKAPAPGGDRCQERRRLPVFPRFRPYLQERPLTQAATVFKTEIVDGRKQTRQLSFDPEGPAAAAFQWKMANVLPAIALNHGTWQPRRDLLASNKFAREFVVEVEADGTAYLRFGDDQHGLRPSSRTGFTARYRVGNGVAGHVGAEAIAHVVSEESAIVAVRNPLPARGGVEPESMEDVRQRAPSAFRTQERAVTEGDYAEVTGRHGQVQQAAATFRWTGSWHTVFLTADRMGGAAVDPAFKEEMRQHVERFRMAGHDLAIDGPRCVSLEISMHVCAKPGYFRSDVKAALLAEFSNRMLPGGRRGVFHPDNFSFGQPVYLSRLYAAAQRVPGVASVNITRFQRQGRFDEKVLAEGKLELGRLEIARLDNDPNFAEHGVFDLKVEGGK